MKDLPGTMLSYGPYSHSLGILYSSDPEPAYMPLFVPMELVGSREKICLDTMVNVIRMVECQNNVRIITTPRGWETESTVLSPVTPPFFV